MGQVYRHGHELGLVSWVRSHPPAAAQGRPAGSFQPLDVTKEIQMENLQGSRLQGHLDGHAMALVLYSSFFLMDDYEQKKVADTDLIMLTVPKSALCFHSTQAKPECARQGNCLIKLPCFGLAKAIWLTPQQGQGTTPNSISTTTSETSGELDPEEAAVSYGAGIPSRASGEVINHQTALATSPLFPSTIHK